MAGDRRSRILDELAAGDGEGSSRRLCQVGAQVIGVSGAGVMLMAGNIPSGSLCTTDEVASVIEDLQYTLGEGPCVDAHRLDRVVLEPDLANPASPRWLAFTPRAVEAGARAVFGFPVGSGGARLGALNLYQDQPGPLSDDQHADALVMAEVIATWVLDAQAGAPPGALPQRLEEGAELYFVVHNAAGAVSVQLDISVTEALIRLRAHAFAHDRPLRDVAEDVVARRLRFS